MAGGDPVEGFAVQESGPLSGLVWVNFKNIQIHGDRGTHAWLNGCAQKAQLVQKVITTELRMDTRHFNKAGVRLKRIEDILRSYQKELGFYVELKGARRNKLEALQSKYGLEVIRDGQDPSRVGSP